MPWKEQTKMDERMKLVTRLIDGERMTDLCREFDISRKTGYKIFHRYQTEGLIGLFDKTTKPNRNPRKIDPYIEELIIEIKKKYPTWGAPKIKATLDRKYVSLAVPATSTIHVILDRNNLVNHRRKRRKAIYRGTSLRKTINPNDLWCADFKGQFRMKNKKYCYPLTITDQKSRYIISCEALDSTRVNTAFFVFKQAFDEYGLPVAIRTDNGVPFASNALFTLSQLSIWWLRLGIELERIEPGHPEQNGRHERMHKTLAEDAINPAAANLLQQQEKFDKFVNVFNNERPHEALQMNTPSEIYVKSNRSLPKHLPNFDYCGYNYIRTVGKSGDFYIGRKIRVYLSRAFCGQEIGLKAIDDGLWKVDFMQYNLGYFDTESLRFSASADNPFF